MHYIKILLIYQQQRKHYKTRSCQIAFLHTVLKKKGVFLLLINFESQHLFEVSSPNDLCPRLWTYLCDNSFMAHGVWSDNIQQQWHLAPYRNYIRSEDDGKIKKNSYLFASYFLPDLLHPYIAILNRSSPFSSYQQSKLLSSNQKTFIPRPWIYCSQWSDSERKYWCWNP